MKDYFFGGSTDWPVFWLVAAVSLLVMVGVSRLIDGEIPVVAGIVAFVFGYRRLARPE